MAARAARGANALPFALAALVAAGAAACGRSKEATGPSAGGLPAASKADIASPAAYRALDSVPRAGSIVGRVVIKGPVPSMKPALVMVTQDRGACGAEHQNRSILIGAEGSVANAVVYLDGIREGKPYPATAPALDQRNCEFVPRVQLARLHDPLEIVNSDAASHNVHAYGPGNESLFNLSTEPKEGVRSARLERNGPVRLKCDVHPWMSGWVYVSESPYAAVTDAEGSFHLDRVPPGRHALRLWHEVLSGAGLDVEVRSGEATRTEVSLSVSGE